MTRRLLLIGIAMAVPLLLASNVGAVTMQTVERNVPYVIGFHPLHSSQHPYLGQMHLNFNKGIISGSYTDISIRPGGPFANARNLPVAGGISSSHVTLIIRHITFRGTVDGDKTSGSATINGTIYQFSAQQGTPGSGKQ